MYDLGDEIDLPFRIYDYDYNKSMAAAEVPMTLSLTVADVLRTESGELVEVRVTTSTKSSDRCPGGIGSPRWLIGSRKSVI